LEHGYADSRIRGARGFNGGVRAKGDALLSDVWGLGDENSRRGAAAEDGSRDEKSIDALTPKEYLECL
jgi:hypothetical protein